MDTYATQLREKKNETRNKKNVNGTIDVERNCGIVNIWLIGILSAIVPLHHYYSLSLVLFVNQFEYNFEAATATAWFVSNSLKIPRTTNLLFTI